MKILIVQLGRIGDMILATPVFKAIKSNKPDAEVYVLASVANNPVIRNNPNIDKIFVWDKSPEKLIPVIFKIRSIQFDYLLDAKDHRSTESSLIAKFVKAKTKIGYNPPGKSYFDIGIDNEKENAGLHFTERALRPLTHLGIKPPPGTPRPELFPSEESKHYVAKFLKNANGRQVVVINLSASYRAKMWDNDKWALFIKAIDNEKFFPIITYAPADKDVAADLLNRIKIAEFKSRSMDDVIALISAANLLVTPDTSLVHVAAAFDKPLLGLFSGLKDFYAKFHPLSSTFRVIHSPEGIDGIKAISAEQAIEGFRELLTEIDG